MNFNDNHFNIYLKRFISFLSTSFPSSLIKLSILSASLVNFLYLLLTPLFKRRLFMFIYLLS